MLSLYVLSVSVAAAFVGSFARSVLAQFGFIPGLRPALYVTLGAALLFAGLQLLYLAVLRIYQPTRGRAMLVTEACSNLAAFALLPAILGIAIPGGSEHLQRAAPLIYFGAFTALHAFFKLASFYAALTGPEDPDRPILAWGISGLAGVTAGAALVLAWRSSVQAGRVEVTAAEQRVLAGTQYARARIVPEGATLSGPITGVDNPTLALRFANADPAAPPQKLYVSVTLNGRTPKLFQGAVNLQPGAWTELDVPGEFFPPDLRDYSIYWTHSREANWQRILGLRPVVYNLPATPGAAPSPPARVYLAGPSVYAGRPGATAPNLLVVFVDGLGADHISLFGYPRDVTPAIDRLGIRGQLFPDTVSTGANAEIALLAAMTAQNPAQLGGPGPGPAVPESLRRAGYATVAFVESNPLEHVRDAPWATGFDLYDDLQPAPAAAKTTTSSSENEDEPAAPASAAIARARAWIADHQLIPFFCLVRVRALADFPPHTTVRNTFGPDSGAMLDVDRFDNALLAVDRELGALFKFIRDYETRSNTCIVLTAPYGHDFSPSASRKFLGVPSEHVPLIIEVPDRRQRKSPKQAHLQDLGATLAALGNVRLATTADGKNLVP